ncbi:MAG: MFS transporter [Prevotella sp.]|jgi:DHA3 family macrolide efflux protein-like MFS transporter|nr:MFS transporter [Prevotella sp.]
MKMWKKTLFIIWTGQALSLLSSAIVQFAIIWWITIQTGSASTLAMASIAGILPQIVLGAFIGVWVDRWDRKKIMIFSDLGIAFFTLLMGALFYFDLVEIWHIYFLLAIRSIGSAFHFPSMQASIPLLAPESQLTRIAGINQVLYSISSIAGPALGALCCELLEMDVIVLIDVAGAIWACSTLAFVKIPKVKPKSDDKNIIRDLKEAFNAIYSNKGLFSLVIAWLIAVFFFVPVDALFPLMTSGYFGRSAFELGIVEVSFGIGMLLGGGIMGIWGKNKGRVNLINGGLIVMGFCYFLAGILTMHQFYFFAVLVFIMGISVPIFNSPIMSLLQTNIDPNMLGRVFSLVDTIALLPVPFGLIFVGTITDRIGISNIFLIAGAAIISVGMVCFFIKPLMALNKEKKPD